MNKLHELLEVALADLAACERDEHYEIDMCDWVNRKEDECFVCLAGACMVRTLHQEEFYRLSSNDQAKMRALNFLRRGEVTFAMHKICIVPDKVVVRDRDVTNYHQDRNQWWADMHQLLAELKEANL